MEQQIIKLYTEEQLHKAFEDGYLYHTEWEGQITEAQFERRFRDVVYSLKQISLPSDEEIEKKFEPRSTMYELGYRDGAKWMREQIKKQII